MAQVNNTTIVLEESVKDTITNTEVDSIDQPLREVSENNINELKNAANTYLLELEKLSVEIKNFQTLLQRQRDLRKANANYAEIETYIQGKEQQRLFLNSDIPKRFYTATFKFQNALNAFIGQKVVMVFVYENSEGEPELYEINNEDLLKYDVASRSNNFVARYNPTQKDLETSMQKLKLDEAFNFNMTNLKITYKEVLFRYRMSRKHNNRIVLWENPSRVWHHGFISAEGDINETYAAIVLLNKKQPDFNASNLELNVEAFVIKAFDVDNESGMLAGDVTVGNIEYGIKSMGASALSANQLINMARTILKDANFDKQSLLNVKKKLHDRRRRRNKEVFFENIEEAVAKDIDTIISLR